MTKIAMSPRTIQLLKNFSQINQSIVFKPGNRLATISASRSIIAIAKVEEQFESTFAIYNLSKFLSVLSLFEEPTLDIKDKFMTISGGGKRVNYWFADLSLFLAKDRADAYVSIDSGRVALPTVQVEFNLTQEALADLKKGLAVLRLPEIAVVGDGANVAIEAVDSKNPSADTYAIDIGKTDKTFRALFRDENLLVTPGDYKVQIHFSPTRKVAKFTGVDVDYYVAVESNSSFEVAKEAA